nr:hypothetical protein [Candidatus Sigynarchaeum springense]
MFRLRYTREYRRSHLAQAIRALGQPLVDELAAILAFFNLELNSLISSSVSMTP